MNIIFDMKNKYTSHQKFTLLFSDIRLFLALGAGTGLSPKAPGTIGTCLALPLYMLLNIYLSFWWMLLIAILMLFFGVFICSYANNRFNTHDEGCIVWDEIAAFFLVLTCIPWETLWILTAFILFRLLDIIKPFPINWIDKKLTGGIGVMMDDIIAALLTISIILFLYKNSAFIYTFSL